MIARVCKGWLCIALVAPILALAAETGTEGGPRLVCDKPEFDFGIVDNNTSVEHVFVLKNEGDKPLDIKKVRACCGASAKLEKNIVAPGSNTTVKVKLSLRGRTGRQRKAMVVMSNDPKQPNYQLVITGIATTEIDVRPSFVYFRDIGENDVVEKRVVISSKPDIVFHVTNVVSTSDRYVVEQKTVEHGKKYELTVRTVPPLPLGVTSGNVIVRTDYPKRARIPVRVTVRVSGELVVTPDKLFFRVEEEKVKPVTRYITIRSRTGKAFKVLSVKPPRDDMKVKVLPWGKAGHRVQVSKIVPSKELNGRSLTIQTDVEKFEKVTVPFRVIVTSKPEIQK